MKTSTTQNELERTKKKKKRGDGDASWPASSNGQNESHQRGWAPAEIDKSAKLVTSGCA